MEGASLKQNFRLLKHLLIYLFIIILSFNAAPAAQVENSKKESLEIRKNSQNLVSNSKLELNKTEPSTNFFTEHINQLTSYKYSQTRLWPSSRSGAKLIKTKTSRPNQLNTKNSDIILNNHLSTIDTHDLIIDKYIDLTVSNISEIPLVGPNNFKSSEKDKKLGGNNELLKSYHKTAENFNQFLDPDKVIAKKSAKSNKFNITTHKSTNILISTNQSADLYGPNSDKSSDKTIANQLVINSDKIIDKKSAESYKFNLATFNSTLNITHQSADVHDLNTDKSSDESKIFNQLVTSKIRAKKSADKLVLDLVDVDNYAEWMRSRWAEELSKNEVCRHKSYLPISVFEFNSCAYCYYYMRNVVTIFGEPSQKWTRVLVEWRHGGTVTHIMALKSVDSKKIVFADSRDARSPILSSFVNEGGRRNWRDCCEAASKCCQRMQKTTQLQSNNMQKQESCPATWDSWQCWNTTKKGIKVKAECPHYIYSVLTEASSCSLTAEKSCEDNGEWYAMPSLGGSTEWTNYSNCANSVIDVQKRRTYVHVTSYAVSIVAIIPALLIFFSYKQLRVDRIKLHQNLFFSMLLNGLFVVLFKTLVILNDLSADAASSPTITSQNGIGCRLLFILTKYSRMTNYLWMFCEGYYLHKLIASAFAEQKSLLIFYLLGWVFPIIPTVTYGLLRLLYANDNCWAIPEESFEWILNGPSLLSLLINMLFLVNIIRVLVTKLRATHANEPSQYRRAVRGTLVLLPLFGAHFVVTIYRPPASGASGACAWFEIYFYLNDILDGLQGFLVALIFCYLNGEVLSLLKRSCRRFREEYGGLSHRPSRRRQSTGRSVVSTQIYSSVPPSPDTCCNKLSFSLSSTPPIGGNKAKNEPIRTLHSPPRSPIGRNPEGGGAKFRNQPIGSPPRSPIGSNMIEMEQMGSRSQV